MVKITACILFLFTLISCSPGMYEMLHRTLDDPKIVKPYVESFTESNAIFISWDYDEAADEYILERAQDSPFTLFFSTVYSGDEQHYADRGLKDDTRYIYRLSKRRGNAVFGPSQEVLGVSSLVIRDLHRNDTMETALHLESADYIANIYYYRSYSGLELIDNDWFYIDLPPLRQASVVVKDAEVELSESPTHFEYYTYGRESNPVLNLRDFFIINNELQANRFYFMLHPAKLQFVGSGIPAGGSIVQYRISLVEIKASQIGG